jgi:hypothetical protein
MKMVEFILLHQLAYKLCKIIFLSKKIFFKEVLSIWVEKTLATYVQLALVICLFGTSISYLWMFARACMMSSNFYQTFKSPNMWWLACLWLLKLMVWLWLPKCDHSMTSCPTLRKFLYKWRTRGSIWKLLQLLWTPWYLVRAWPCYICFMGLALGMYYLRSTNMFLQMKVTWVPIYTIIVSAQIDI